MAFHILKRRQYDRRLLMPDTMYRISHSQNSCLLHIVWYSYMVYHNRQVNSQELGNHNIHHCTILRPLNSQLALTCCLGNYIGSDPNMTCWFTGFVTSSLHSLYTRLPTGLYFFTLQQDSACQRQSPWCSSQHSHPYQDAHHKRDISIHGLSTVTLGWCIRIYDITCCLVQTYL